jgi:hypothetical protein
MFFCNGCVVELQQASGVLHCLLILVGQSDAMAPVKVILKALSFSIHNSNPIADALWQTKVLPIILPVSPGRDKESYLLI